jgi:hypothetical protein
MAPFVLEIIQFNYFRVLTKFLISPTELFCQEHIEIRNMQTLGLNPSQLPIIPLMHIGTGVKMATVGMFDNVLFDNSKLIMFD